MITFLLNHPVVLSLAIFVVLTLFVEIGFRSNVHASTTEKIQHDQIKETRDGIIFLLSLLLGFTLAMALTRYDQRKQLVVDEANAIGTTGLRARLLPEPYSGQMTTLLAEYGDVRLAYVKGDNDARSVQAELARTKQLQNRIWEITREVSRASPTAITSTFIQSLNETIDLSEKQTATVENRIPRTVWLMILIIAVLACFASGMALQQRILFSRIITPLTAAVVISLTADLDSPRSGLIRIGINSMERVQADLHSGLPK